MVQDSYLLRRHSQWKQSVGLSKGMICTVRTKLKISHLTGVSRFTDRLSFVPRVIISKVSEQVSPNSESSSFFYFPFPISLSRTFLSSPLFPLISPLPSLFSLSFPFFFLLLFFLFPLSLSLYLDSFLSTTISVESITI